MARPPQRKLVEGALTMTLKVYAIEDSTRNLVKIGISKQPAERCKQIALIACSIGYEPNFVLLGSAPIEFGSLFACDELRYRPSADGAPRP